MFFTANNGQLTDQVRKAPWRIGWLAGKWSDCFKTFGAVSFAFVLVVILGGCSVQSKIDQVEALREAINVGQIEGITEKDIPAPGILYTYPARHKGEFSSVSVLKVSVAVLNSSNGKYKNEYWSVVMGMSRVDDKWKVIRVAKQTGPEKWEELPLVVPPENTIQP